MDREKIKGIIEAILFASGKIVTLEELSISLEIDKKEVAKDIVRHLAEII